MGNAIGAGAYVAYDDETTEGTGVTPTDKHWIRSFSASRAPSFEVVEPLGHADDALPNPRALFVQSVESGGSFVMSGYYNTDLMLKLHKHVYGAVATGGAGPYTWTFTLTRALPTKPSMTLEFVRGQGGPTNSAESYNGCRFSRYVRTIQTGGVMEITADFIAQTCDDRAAPTGSLSFPTGQILAYHADLTNFTFNSVQFDEIVSATLTIDRKLTRTPKLGSLTTGAPMIDDLAECTLEIRLRYYTNALQQALIAGTTAAGSLTCTNGTESIVDTFPRMQVVSVSDDVGGPGAIEQTVTFRLLSTPEAGPVSTVVTNSVSP